MGWIRDPKSGKHLLRILDPPDPGVKLSKRHGIPCPGPATLHYSRFHSSGCGQQQQLQIDCKNNTCEKSCIQQQRGNKTTGKYRSNTCGNGLQLLTSKMLQQAHFSFTDLVVEVPEAEDGLLLDLAEDGEEGRLHSVAVKRVLPSLNNPRRYKFFKKLFQPPVFRIRIRLRIRMFLGFPDPHPDPLVKSTDPDADPDSSLFP
jgi:hypothetical protein